MVDRELLIYIIRSLALAREEAQVRAELTAAGWDLAEIDEAYAEARRLLSPAGNAGIRPMKYQTSGLPIIEVPRITFGRIFLFIGVLITVCAAAFFVTINWLSWSPIERFLSLLMPLLLCALCGGILWRAREKATAAYFLFAAGLLTPFVLFAVSSEVLLFEFIFPYSEHSSQYPWGTSLLASTVAYMLCRKYFGHLGWTFLAGVSAILGFGALGSILLTTSSDSEYVARAFMWGALIASAAVTAIAIKLEKSGAQAEAKLLYVPPMLGTAIPLLALGLMGAHIRPFLGDKRYWQYEWLVFGGSVLISGIIALALARGAAVLHKRGYLGISPYGGIFGAFGCILALTGGMIIGTADSEMYREFIWLALIIAAIFFGQRLQVRSFLYIGTLFLVIFVFQFGFEYFRNEIGWPLVLFGAGLISLTLGVIAERMSRGWKNNSR